MVWKGLLQEILQKYSSASKIGLVAKVQVWTSLPSTYKILILFYFVLTTQYSLKIDIEK